ncbi:MAG: type II secretion system protein [Planctomycetales bacterium]|nr:type II secretion system protein [Planctomycetales bacterium]
MKTRQHRHGFSLIEVTFSILIVSILLSTSLVTLSNVVGMGHEERLQSQALRLANYLLGEVSALPFEDPEGSSGIGTDTSEVSDRFSWDDCDDCHNITLSPITTRNGTDIAPDWTAKFTVTWMTPNSLAVTATATDLKAIRLLLTHSSGQTVTLFVLRSRHGVLQEPATSAQITSSAEFLMKADSKPEQVFGARLNNQQGI